METLSVDYDSGSLKSIGVDPVYIKGSTPVFQCHTPSCPWELQPRQPVSKLTLLVNGAATSGRVSQPNKILIGELLGNSLIWPEGTEVVFCLSVNRAAVRQGGGDMVFLCWQKAVHVYSVKSITWFFLASSEFHLSDVSPVWFKFCSERQSCLSQSQRYAQL